MNNYIKGTLVKLLAVLLILVISLAISVGFLVNDDYFKDITNSCRVLVSDQIYNIGLNNPKGDEGYKYTLITLDGEVIKSTEAEYPERISVSNISLENWYETNNKDIIRYTAPYIVDGKIENIIVFSIPKEDILAIREGINFKFIFKITTAIIFILIIIMLYKIYKLINKDVLIPIKEMHNSASEILNGNYLKTVNYDYHGEIGAFSHDFESMRDNLMVASEKEKKLKIAEKELLACISHDLKTPIANISGYCEGIIDGVVREEKDIKRYASIILKKARVLTKLLDDILELSKAEINQMTINKKEVYTREFFGELIEEISIDIVSSGRSFNFNGEIPNILINIDEEKITQVVNNIVSNSIKYTNDDGVITMSLSKIHEGIEINIEDNGIGVAANEVDLVFNKFYRSEKHRNQNIPGSGLGLSIAKYITEMHNGYIEMISGRGIGTKVSVKIRN